MSRAKEISGPCPESDRIGPYLSGKLDEAETEAFERHYFGCAACGNALERATEIRAAFAESSTRRARVTPGWMPLAVAASLAAVALGAIWLWPASMRDDAMRGASHGIVLVVESTPDTLSVDWNDVTRADVYEVSLLGVEGNLLLRSEVSDSAFRVARDTLTPRAPDGTTFWRVVARDELRRIVADSGLVRVDPGGGGNAP